MQCNILYEDNSIIVIHKPAGFPVQTGRIGSADCVSELKNYLSRSGSRQAADRSRQPYLGIVHRLDQPVEGLMVFAKTSSAAAKLSAQVSKEDGGMSKCYEAEVYGKLPEREGELKDFLLRDGAGNSSRVVESGEKEFPQAKESRLSYRVLSGTERTQKLYIRLHTGRHHQIRVQLSHAGAPILGDQKYGTPESAAYSKEHGIRNVALRAVHLELVHPATGKKMCWELPADEKD